jgi:diacylglycerol kinase
MFVCTVTSIYLAVQWFAYTDHSLPELSNDPKGKLQHDEAFRIESVVSIVCLCIIRVIHVSPHTVKPLIVSI